MHFYLLILFLINFLKIISVDSKPFVMANADEYPQYRDYLRKKFGTNPSKFGPPDDELPEYKEYLKNLEANNSPIFEQNDQVFEFEQLGNKLNLPLPCTEIKDDSGGYNFYCIALFLLWVMIILCALIYQLRSLIILKAEIAIQAVRKSDKNNKEFNNYEYPAN